MGAWSYMQPRIITIIHTLCPSEGEGGILCTQERTQAYNMGKSNGHSNGHSTV